jgi:hypothetical protein
MPNSNITARPVVEKKKRRMMRKKTMRIWKEGRQREKLKKEERLKRWNGLL